MDIVLDEWRSDHYNYILHAVWRHCSSGSARQGWGEALAMVVSTILVCHCDESLVPWDYMPLHGLLIFSIVRSVFE